MNDEATGFVAWHRWLCEMSEAKIRKRRLE